MKNEKQRGTEISTMVTRLLVGHPWPPAEHCAWFGAASGNPVLASADLQNSIFLDSTGCLDDHVVIYFFPKQGPSKGRNDRYLSRLDIRFIGAHDLVGHFV